MTAITITNITKTFGKKRALDDVSLSIPEGQIFGFLGPNGAGKTTMIRCLMDYIRPSSGEINIFGKDARASSSELKRSIGYLSSDSQLHADWSAKTHIDFLANVKGRGASDDLINKFDLDLGTKVRSLSSGNKQKLAIVLAFMGEPKLLILDEPTKGLDPLLQNQLYQLLREFANKGGTAFLSSHNLSEVQHLCSNVAVIRAGKIVAYEAMADILQMKVHVIRATASSNIDPKKLKIKGVEILDESPASVYLKVRGRVDPVLKVLSQYSLEDLEVSHASLEDVFMDYY